MNHGIFDGLSISAVVVQPQFPNLFIPDGDSAIAGMTYGERLWHQSYPNQRRLPTQDEILDEILDAYRKITGYTICI